MTDLTVSGFVLFDPAFPGSLAFCTKEISAVIEEMQPDITEAAVRDLRRQIKRLERIAKTPPEKMLEDGLHEFVDNVQLELIGLHNDFSKHFFPVVEPLAETT